MIDTKYYISDRFPPKIFRYLGDNDIDALKHECATFTPFVVHFICHGERNPATAETQIILKRVIAQANGERVTERLPLSSRELMDAFVEAKAVPAVVVLNACYAGGANRDQLVSDDGLLPFAADSIRFFGRPSPRSRRTSRTSIIVTSRYIHASWSGVRPRTGDLYRAVRRKGGKVLKTSLQRGERS